MKFRRFLLLILSAFLMMTMCATSALAETYSASTLDLTVQTSDVDIDVLSWDYESRTLTIKEGYTLEIGGSSYYEMVQVGLVLPADSTLVINDRLVINFCGICIWAEGDLTIKGVADEDWEYLSFNGFGYGIYCDAEGSTLTLEGVSNYMMSEALFAGLDYSDGYDMDNLVISTLSKTTGVGHLTAYDVDNLVISDCYCGSFPTGFLIGATGDVLIENSTILCRGIVGDTVEITGCEYVDATYVVADQLAVSDSDFTAVVLSESAGGDKIVGTVYGDMGYFDYVLSYISTDLGGNFDELRFAEGSTLTIGSGYEVDLSPFTVYAENANVVVDGGTLTLPAGVTLADLQNGVAVTETVVTPTETAVAETVTAGTALATDANILVDGVATSFDAYEIEGSNYFKLRDIAYVLSGTAATFEVAWSSEFAAISMTTGDEYSAVGGEMVAGDGSAQACKVSTATLYLNGEEISLEAYEIKGYNYFKLRDLGDALGFGVAWDEAAQTIAITSAE